MAKQVLGVAILLLTACGDPDQGSVGGNNATKVAPGTGRNLAAAMPVQPPEEPTAAAPAAASSKVSACRRDGDRLLDGPVIRALGTEPFWGARIEGRCITYSTPEDQQGTRVWTRSSDGPDGAIFTGALNGRPFQLSLRGSQGCSDGMSDRTYPISVQLLVEGERRAGCAEPL